MRSFSCFISTISDPDLHIHPHSNISCLLNFDYFFLFFFLFVCLFFLLNYTSFKFPISEILYPIEGVKACILYNLIAFIPSYF